MSKVAPCKGCVPPKRTPTCHTTCKDYLDWKTEWDAMREQIRKEKEKYESTFKFKPKRRY